MNQEIQDHGGETEKPHYKEAWEKLRNPKSTMQFRIINEGLKLGVPHAELKSYVLEAIQYSYSQGNYYFAWTIMDSFSASFPDRVCLYEPAEIKAASEQACVLAMEAQNFYDAIRLAEKIDGKDSTLWCFVDAAQKESADFRASMRERIKSAMAESGIVTTTSTLANLFDFIEAREQGAGFVECFLELFGGVLDGVANRAVVMQELNTLRKERRSEAASMTIGAFLKKHGCVRTNFNDLFPPQRKVKKQSPSASAS